jgi:predicted small secreted protein
MAKYILATFLILIIFIISTIILLSPNNNENPNILKISTKTNKEKKIETKENWENLITKLQKLEEEQQKVIEVLNAKK